MFALGLQKSPALSISTPTTGRPRRPPPSQVHLPPFSLSAPPLPRPSRLPCGSAQLLTNILFSKHLPCVSKVITFLFFFSIFSIFSNYLACRLFEGYIQQAQFSLGNWLLPFLNLSLPRAYEESMGSPCSNAIHTYTHVRARSLCTMTETLTQMARRSYFPLSVVSFSRIKFRPKETCRSCPHRMNSKGYETLKCSTCFVTLIFD